MEWNQRYYIVYNDILYIYSAYKYNPFSLCSNDYSNKIFIDASSVKEKINNWTFSGILDSNLNGDYYDGGKKILFKASNNIIEDNLVGVNEVEVYYYSFDYNK